MRLASLLILAGLCATPALAHADARTPLAGEHWEAGVGFVIAPDPGVSNVDAPSAMGLLASLGRQLGHWRFAGEYGFVSFDDPWAGRAGQQQRMGLIARYRLVLPNPAAAPFDSGLYLEAGAGRQTIAWMGGGEVSRKDLVFGLGFEIAGGSHRIGGLDVGLKVVAAPRVYGAMNDHTLDLAWMIHIGGIVGY